MKASELRLGNVTSEGVIRSFVDGGIHLGMGKCFKFSELKPIPITEEWLVKFGFEKVGENCYKHYNLCIPFHFEFNVGIEYLESDELPMFIFYQYVHQLQNLYHALTNEELNYDTKI